MQEGLEKLERDSNTLEACICGEMSPVQREVVYVQIAQCIDLLEGGQMLVLSLLKSLKYTIVQRGAF